MIINYSKTKKEFDKVAPDLLKQFGFSESEITNCIKEVESENKIRDDVISNLKNKYSLSKYREDFPVMVYVLNDENMNIFIEHDCSRWINVYKDDRLNYTTFDPLEDDCLDNIVTHIDDLTKNIKIQEEL